MYLAGVYDNKILLEKDPDYISKLQIQNPVECARLLNGNWKTRQSGGLVFSAKSFRKIPPSEVPSNMRMVRYWDRAATPDGGDFTVGVLMGCNEGKYYVLDVQRGQWRPGERDQVISRTAVTDGFGTGVYFEQEPGSSGKDSADALIKLLAGFNVRADKVTGSKHERALPLAAQVQHGNVFYVPAQWNDSFIRELNDFPIAKYDDQVDAASGAFNALAQAHRTSVSNYSLRGPSYISGRPFVGVTR